MRFVSVMLWVSTMLAGAATWSEVQLPFRLSTGEGARKHLPATMPGGVAVFDFDNDGLLDVFLPNGGDLPAGSKSSGEQGNRLLRNLGGMRFEDVTAGAGVAGREYAFGASAGDYDGDGDLDLAVSELRGVRLYRNQGDGVFSDVTAVSGIHNQGRWSVAAVWFDLENDGDLDLFVVNYVAWSAATERECVVNGKADFCHPRFYEPTANALFRNEGGGRFTDVSAASGIAGHRGKGMSVAAADLDGDGRTDLFVTNDRTFAFLFHNEGRGRFSEGALEAGVAVPQDGKPVSGMGVDAQDYDNDGVLDLVYTALQDETFPLYKGSGKEWIEATASSRLSVLSRSLPGWGIAFADLDNDGYKDIAAASSDALSPEGGRGEAAKGKPVWFRSTGDGRFAAGEGWEHFALAMYRGLVAADFDNDGCLDLLLTALRAPARILRNPCNSGRNWLHVRVAQPGTRVRVNGQWRTFSTAVGYASSNAGPLHYGLGAAKEAEVEAMFPNGRHARMRTAVNRTITLKP